MTLNNLYRLLIGILCLLIVADLVYGLFQASQLYMMKRAMVGSDIELNIYVEEWTIIRPFAFSGLNLLGLIGLSRKDNQGHIMIVVSWLIMLGCYLSSWQDLYSLYKSYMKMGIEKLNIQHFFGFNEWDALRGVLMLIIFSMGFVHIRKLSAGQTDSKL